MQNAELKSKLRDIHTLITQSMISKKDRRASDEFLIEAEDKLNDLENEIAIEAE